MDLEVDDQMMLISQFYSSAMETDQILQQNGLIIEKENTNAQRRRRMRKADAAAVGGVMRKRKLNEEQLIVLEKSFGTEHKLESERKDQLAAELGLDPRQVAVWFQNRRAKLKSKKLEEEYSQLKNEHHNAVAEKCYLEEELAKLKGQLVYPEPLEELNTVIMLLYCM